MPARVTSAGASPTCGKPFSSGVTRSQFSNNRPHGLPSTCLIWRSAFIGYQKLS